MGYGAIRRGEAKLQSEFTYFFFNFKFVEYLTRWLIHKKPLASNFFMLDWLHPKTDLKKRKDCNLSNKIKILEAEKSQLFFFLNLFWKTRLNNFFDVISTFFGASDKEH